MCAPTNPPLLVSKACAGGQQHLAQMRGRRPGARQPLGDAARLDAPDDDPWSARRFNQLDELTKLGKFNNEMLALSGLED